jgi:3-isopropylmalate/(R)-2-methylmalate dehydratase small subunit
VNITGTALVYPDANDVNTDVIWPGKYTYVQIAYEDMPTHAMETFDPDFGSKIAGKSVLVVGRNFGCGSSREQASECLEASGVRLILARSFARIFYRNSINLGLAVVECPAGVDAATTGAKVAVDLAAGELVVDDQRFEIAPYPPFVLELIRDGGLISHIRKQGETE